jgi:MFS family permease
MNTDLEQYRERAKKYWFMDGLVEIGTGLLCFLLAIVFEIENLFNQSPFRDVSFFILALLGALAVRRLIQRVKEHSTYPRTGYVSNKKDPVNKKVVLFAIAFTAVLLLLQIYWLVFHPIPIEEGPLIGGLIFAFIFTLIAYQMSLPRFNLYAILSLVIGSMLSLVGFTDLAGAAILSALIGIILVISGGITHRSYLQYNSPYEGNNGS